MNVALIMTAVQQGATVANYVEVTELHKDTPGTGKLYGARVKDKLTGEEWNVRAKVRQSPLDLTLPSLTFCTPHPT